MPLFTTCLAFLTSLTFSFSGQQQQTSSEKFAKEQAEIMSKAFISRDFKTVAHYTNPAVVEAMGGEAASEKMLEQLVANMQQKGIIFKGVVVDKVTKMVKAGNELQCTVPQHMEIKLPGKRIVVTSILIGVSTDGGKDWTFIDTSNKDMATIRKMLPRLSTDIVIPPSQPPVEYKD